MERYYNKYRVLLLKTDYSWNLWEEPYPVYTIGMDSFMAWVDFGAYERNVTVMAIFISNIAQKHDIKVWADVSN